MYTYISYIHVDSLINRFISNAMNTRNSLRMCVLMSNDNDFIRKNDQVQCEAMFRMLDGDHFNVFEEHHKSIDLFRNFKAFCPMAQNQFPGAEGICIYHPTDF